MPTSHYAVTVVAPGLSMFDWMSLEAAVKLTFSELQLVGSAAGISGMSCRILPSTRIFRNNKPRLIDLCLVCGEWQREGMRHA
jgi:hypothetical protein